MAFNFAQFGADAGLSALGSLFGLAGNSMQFSQQKKLADYQFKQQMQMYNTQRANMLHDNLYGALRERQGREMAGMNPLEGSQFSPNVAVPAGSVGGIPSAPSAGILEGISAMSNAKLANAQAGYVESQKEGQDIDNLYKGSREELNLKLMQAGFDLTETDIQWKKTDMQRLLATTEQINATIEQIHKSTENIVSQTANLNAQTAGQLIDNQYKAMLNDATIKQIQAHTKCSQEQAKAIIITAHASMLSAKASMVSANANMQNAQTNAKNAETNAFNSRVNAQNARTNQYMAQIQDRAQKAQAQLQKNQGLLIMSQTVGQGIANKQMNLDYSLDRQFKAQERKAGIDVMNSQYYLNCAKTAESIIHSIQMGSQTIQSWAPVPDVSEIY